MKHQSIQKFFAFILAIFSLYSSFAQCKKNEVLVCYTSRSCGCTICICEPKRGNGHQLASFTTPSELLSINSTSINVVFSESQNVSLKIYDITGRLIKPLTDRRMSEGEHQIDWNTETIKPGIYFLRMKTPGYAENKKLIVLK